jgi:acetylornithine deacetylase
VSDPGRDVVDLLARLVAVDSVNPGLVSGAAGEARIAGVVRDWALAASLAAELVEHGPGRSSVVVRGGRPGARRLLLCGHLDTVGPGGMTDPLVPRIEGDRLYGRGAYDMKAGLAAALVACREAHRAGLPGEVVVAAVADEEDRSAGVRALLPGLDADAAIVTEPTEMAVGVATRGSCGRRSRSRGWPRTAPGPSSASTRSCGPGRCWSRSSGSEPSSPRSAIRCSARRPCTPR